MTTDRCDLGYWFPLLQSSGVAVPRTTVVKATGSIAEVVYNRTSEHFEPLVAELKKAADAYGYPCFLRTGHGSGKHEWKRTCFVEDGEKLADHVKALVEWSEVVDFIGLPTETWAVREMLPLVTSFEAFMGRMPINKERRYFFDTKPARVVCHHPYWPSVAIEDPSRHDWVERLAALNRESDEEVAYLSAQTLRVAEAFDGAWCVDWAFTKDGQWYAIDMAVASQSFHWDDCTEALRLGSPWREPAKPVDHESLLVPVPKTGGV